MSQDAQETTLTTEQESATKRLLTDAVKFADETLSPKRDKASRYYNGEPFGNEEPGRSQLVLSEVRDGVQGVLPSLLRVHYGPERVMEFVPTDPSMVDAAREATDAVHAVLEENNGFLLAHSVLKDGLVKKLGIYKWGVEDTKVVDPPFDAPPLPEEALAAARAALEKADVEIVAETPSEEGVVLTLRRTRIKRAHKVWALPPEEFLFDANARSVQEATLIAHRTEKRTSELLLLGVSQEDIDAHGGTDMTLRDNAEAQSRRDAIAERDHERESVDDSGDLHLYVEAYVRIATEEGIEMMHKVCTIGPEFHVLSAERVSEWRPFSVFCPDPEPHTMVGQSWADRLMDMQLYKSSLVRGVNDSLALSIFPRLAFIENQVNVEDVLNTEIGAPIRTRVANAIQPILHAFVGKEAMPLLAYADDIVERRTGRNKGTAGLDANSVQSSTREGVAAVLAQSQEQQELLARIFAEGTLKPLFLGLLELLITEPTNDLMVRVGGAWKKVDPAQWPPNMGVAVHMMLGTSFLDSRVNDLMLVASKQEALLQSLGPANPLVSLPQYRATMARILHAKGFRDDETFFLPIAPDWQPPPPEPPKPTPEEILAQAQLEVEKMRTEKELDIKAEELALKRADLEMQDARAREEATARLEMELLKMEMEMKTRLEIARIQYGAKAVNDEMQAEIDAERVDVERERIAADLAKKKADLHVKKADFATKREIADINAAAKSAGAASE